METRDWSLVFFTVLTQAAVGAFLTLQVLQYPPNPGRRTPVPLVVVLAVLSVGLFAALFHLSSPLQAARAVVNFSSSWLSREIVFGSLFAGLLSVLVWHERRAAGSARASPAPEQRAASPSPAIPTPAKPAPTNPAFTNPAAANPVPADAALPTWLPPLAAAAGLAFLCCQIAIYLLPAQPAWNSFATPAAFGGTALRLGILGVAAGLVVRNLATVVGDPAQPGGTPATTLRGLALAGIAALALEFVVVPLHLASLAANPLPAAAASVQRLTGDYGGILLLRLGLLGGAAAALAAVLAFTRGPAGPAGRSRTSAHRLASPLACSAFGLTVASEACGRFLFYAMQVRVGI